MSRLFYLGDNKTVDWQEVPGISPTSLSYNDVLLVPQETHITSRSDVDTSIEFGPFTLRLPIISAPMDTITGEAMARELARLGGIAALPRANNKEQLEDRLAVCKRLAGESIPCLYSVGLKLGLEDAKALKNSGAQMILVDVANGAMQQAKELAKEIKSSLKVTVVAGNIATRNEAESYKSYGIDVAKVGIGPGGLCTTRLIAATGIPQLSAIFDTTPSGMPVIADGGVVHPGDVAKAIAAGATMVMIGSYFAGAEETPGEIDAQGMKTVRGQASFSYMEDHGVNGHEFRTAEGITTRVRAKGPVKHLVSQIEGGLRSAMSYAGARTIKEFQERAQFCIVSPATISENQPHILQME